MKSLFFFSVIALKPLNLPCLTFSEQDSKSGIDISCKGRKMMFADRPSKLSTNHIVVMVAGIHISQEIFAFDILTALKPSLEHDRKHASMMLCICYDCMKIRLN